MDTTPLAARGEGSQSQPQISRRLPIGAELQAAGGVHFRVWAPRRKQVAAVVVKCVERNGDAGREQPIPLQAEADGYFAGFAPNAAPGDCYGFCLDEDPKLYPDPASRFQPNGPHGLSMIVDPSAYRWR